MSIQEKVIHALEEMGYKPTVDDDGDVMFRYQMKSLYVLGTQKDDCNFLVVATNLRARCHWQKFSLTEHCKT